MNPLNIAAFQLDLAWQAPEANRTQIESQFSRLAPDTDLVFLPEMFTTGFSMTPAPLAETMDGPSVAWMVQMAQQHEIVLGGSLIIQSESGFVNRFVIVDGKGVLGHYDKRHLFRMAGEDESYQAGDEIFTFTHKGWRICPLVCYDLRFPVWARNRRVGEEMTYDLLVYVANWPSPRVSHWDTLLMARAIENQSYVLGVNRVGLDGNDVPYNGHSALYDPKGNRISYAAEQPAILSATLDDVSMKAYRRKFPVWKDSDFFSLHP
ncbi:amidohydrolase [Pontibacter sp. G13]|uniref:amidohydrolase n=1 Tax=Pontibacter sp. G13 TaxID=3074898 RepID=UPI0028896DCB|nr:amidohydrolase [Pontibacter sp. G13]WNJ17460.1 amidohydrolase [Pontibacter sp. G13]